jgi:hypothetical protein
MSQSQQPVPSGLQPGTAEAPAADGSVAVAAALPAPPAHAPDLGGMESPFAAWSVAGGGGPCSGLDVAAAPAGDRPVDALPPLPQHPAEPLAELEFDIAGVAASILPGAVSYFGPVGRRRSPAGQAVLAVLTLGISALRWHARVNREMGNFDPRMTVRPRRSLLAVAIPFAAGWLVALVAAARIAAAHIATGTSVPLGTDAAYWLLGAPLLIPLAMLLVPFSLAAVVGTAERVRVVEDRVDIVGADQVRPASLVCWLLVPVAGGLIMIAMLQRRLNAVYASVSSG